MSFDVRCKKCDREFSAPTWTTKHCRECAKAHAAERRAVYERAYFAALGGLAGIDGLADVETVYHAQQCALETVRQWPAMMAELEQEIAK